MNIEAKQGTLIEINSSEGYVLDMGDGTYETYVCVPSYFDTSIIKEIKLSEVEEKAFIEEIKSKKIQEINEYDTSKNVNEFFVNGMSLWIPRETRVSLHNSTQILIKKGVEMAVLWEGIIKFELPCEMLIRILDEIEVYALDCFNVTSEHKANVMNLKIIEEIKNYDYKLGYPDKLEFTL